MSKLIRPKPDASFFIGWSPDIAPVDRRFLIASALGLTVAGGAAAAGLAAAQKDPGPGTWDQGTILDVEGFVTADPYPLIRSARFGDGGTALFSSMTKCGVRDRIAAQTGPARVRGSLIRRGPHRMIAVVDGPDWLTPLADADLAPQLAAPPVRSLGGATLQGQVLDTKCWFGAMRPAAGKVHKACAALCIRYGLPPAFFAVDAAGREHALIMTAPDGGFITPTEAFLAKVGDPVEADGEIVLLGDLPTFRVDPRAIRRI